jgi:UDP-N-acetylmuramate-alanine ligase
MVLVAPPYHSDRLAADEVLDRAALAEDLATRGVASLMPERGDDPAKVLVAAIHPGDVVVGCSSGDFGGFHRKLVDALQAGGTT